MSDRNAAIKAYENYLYGGAKNMGYKDTYELERTNKDCVLEIIEWDDIWYESANDTTVKRIMTIGDSISRGFRPFLNEIANSKGTIIDMLATSKAVDNPFFTTLISYAISQQPTCESILLALGGHGFHLTSEQFGQGFSKLVKFIKDHYPEKRILTATFIPIRKKDDHACLSENNAKIKENNLQIKAVAKEFDLPVIDLYDKLLSREDLFELSHIDGVHLNDKGYRFLAECVADYLWDNE